MNEPNRHARLRLRLARPDDMLLLYRWATDPETMRMRISSNPITPEDHEQWFWDALASEEVHLFIAETAIDPVEPIGQVRVDETDEIHVGLAPEWRGKRLATPLIEAGTDQAHNELGKRTVVAHVLPKNTPSRRAFERAGYELAGEVSIRNVPCLRYEHRAEA